MPNNRNQANPQSNPIQPAQAAPLPAVIERDPADVSTYRILNRSEEEVAKALDVFQHNLRGQKITERDLPRIKVPPQGISIWSIPTAEGDVHTEELTGILVEYTTPRAYWDKPMEPGSVIPPVCSSPDGIRGDGKPGGPCHECPFSKYGSDPREDSNGQACKEKRMLFLLQPDSILPLVVQAPSTSIRNVFDYTVMLSNQETLFQNVYTKLTLEKVAAGSVEYSKVALKNGGVVPEEYHPQIDSYLQGLTRIIGAQAVEILPDAENTVAGESKPAANGEPGPEPEPAGSES